MSQTSGDIIFSVIYKAISLQDFFFARNQSAGYFFGNHPYVCYHSPYLYPRYLEVSKYEASPVQYALIQICLATAEPFLWYTSVQGTLPIRGHSLVANKSSHNLCPFVYFEGTPLFRRQEHFFSGSQNPDLTSIQEGVDGVN